MTWAGGLWIISAAYIPFLYIVASRAERQESRHARKIGALMCLWIAAVSVWWISAFGALHEQPLETLRRGEFFLGERTFFFFSMLGSFVVAGASFGKPSCGHCSDAVWNRAAIHTRHSTSSGLSKRSLRSHH